MRRVEKDPSGMLSHEAEGDWKSIAGRNADAGVRLGVPAGVGRLYLIEIGANRSVLRAI